MSSKTPFQGIRGANQIITTSGTSQSVTIPISGESVRVVNTGGTNFCHVRIGKGTQIATAADSPVLAGESIVFHKANDDDTVALLQDTGAEVVHVQPGIGGI